MNNMRWYINSKKVILLIISLTFLLFLFLKDLSFTNKKNDATHNIEDTRQRAEQNTENLQQTIRDKISREINSSITKDSLSVIATEDRTIYSIYTFEKQNVYTNYLTVAELFPDEFFEIKSYCQIKSEYTNLPVSTEVRELLEKQAKITIQDNIDAVLTTDYSY